MVGCSNEIKNEGNKIVVEKLNEISDSKEVQKVKNILDSIRWENVAVSMAYPPHYKFYFEDFNEESSGFMYDLWISPNKDKVELVTENESKYIQLNEQNPSELFEIITDKKLN
jgi:hypothetical protein